MNSPATSPRACAADTVLRRALEANHQRFTEQRAAVYRYLRATDEHPTADEVFTAVRAEVVGISLATVYKALEVLVRCGLASKISSGDGSARYDRRTDDHVHARCRRCGAVRDIPADRVSGSLPTVTPRAGFQVESCRIEVIGVCAACAG